MLMTWSGSGRAGIAPRSLEASPQPSQRQKLLGRIDGRTFKSLVNWEWHMGQIGIREPQMKTCDRLAGSGARSTSRIGDSGETARESGARQSTVRQRNDTKRTVVGEKRKRDEIRTRRQRCRPEGRARRGRTRGTHIPNTEAD